ncbi:MAG TPA: hypothetical protein VNG53_07240, partial [Bacteroidia bacterium]|nr:hypothetical protein [Bacteroidia bacterium]
MAKKTNEILNVEFMITSLCRYDLTNSFVGFTESKARAITDEQMRRIASKMSDDYCEQLFWGSLKIIA